MGVSVIAVGDPEDEHDHALGNVGEPGVESAVEFHNDYGDYSNGG